MKEPIVDGLLPANVKSRMDKFEEMRNIINEQARLLASMAIENSAMYAALLEASQLDGKSAALRCTVELQRIARNDAMK